jgi:Domain of unknown function (DUF4160)
MPSVSSFYGIVITMYFYDHQPPHFHARYAEHDAAIRIADASVLVGSLPARANKLVSEWAGTHRDELQANWRLAQAGKVPNPIDPLR